MLPNIIPPPTITWPIVVQRFPSLGRLGWGFILAFRPGVLSARMWKRGCCPTKTLVLPPRLYRTRDRCAVPKTLLQCVCTQRRNRIGRLSSFSEYAPTARAIKPDSAAKALWICQGSSPQRRRHVVLDVEVSLTFRTNGTRSVSLTRLATREAGFCYHRIRQLQYGHMRSGDLSHASARHRRLVLIGGGAIGSQRLGRRRPSQRAGLRDQFSRCDQLRHKQRISPRMALMRQR